MTLTIFVFAMLGGVFGALVALALGRAAGRGDEQLRATMVEIRNLRRDVDDGGH